MCGAIAYPSHAFSSFEEADARSDFASIQLTSAAPNFLVLLDIYHQIDTHQFHGEDIKTKLILIDKTTKK